VGTPTTAFERMSVITIIEDDDLMRGLLQEWLTDAGYAVRQLRTNETAPASTSLVIVDLQSPRQTGAEIVRAAQAANPGAPIIAISGRFRAGLAGCSATAQALGVRRIIAKPLTRGELLDAIHDLVGTAA
jgi:DNA-binding response OmpR family regulator